MQGGRPEGIRGSKAESHCSPTWGMRLRCSSCFEPRPWTTHWRDITSQAPHPRRRGMPCTRTRPGRWLASFLASWRGTGWACRDWPYPRDRRAPSILRPHPARPLHGQVSKAASKCTQCTGSSGGYKRGPSGGRRPVSSVMSRPESSVADPFPGVRAATGKGEAGPRRTTPPPLNWSRSLAWCR